MKPSNNSEIEQINLETIYAEPLIPETTSDSWWSRYASTLGNFTPSASKVLEADCRYIVESGIFGAGLPSADAWGGKQARTGLVMGSVQSGKTASMLGTIAMSLDRGIDVVILLAGTRISLWQQTLERFSAQLDGGADSSAKQRRRLLIPKVAPLIALAPDERYRLRSARVELALSRRQPIVIVALKNSAHLQALSRSLSAALHDRAGQLDRSVHMLVVDDEADDGSILDANVEASMDPLDGNLKQIPRAIVDLWSPPGRPAPPNLFATYVAYTATPQANFLQEGHNPLAPRDFVVALRTPFDRGEIDTRASTYKEPKGMAHYYTGGETYYRRARAAGLTIPTTGVPQDDLGNALRAFLVAGAIRVHRGADRLGPMSARMANFSTFDEAKRRSPQPHSMLLHPSALVSDHFAVAEDVLLWAGVDSRNEAKRMLLSDCLLPSAISERLEAEEPLWRAWLEAYASSATTLHDEFNSMSSADFPDWETIKDLLITEVLPGTRLAVINSDPMADDRPEYDPEQFGADEWSAPRDMFTIFVAGNVMARGLTLEGLTTTLFLRNSDTPRADSQMQMQRWFGFRGAYVELCRVFASQTQLNFFAEYHDVDEALRALISEAMVDGQPAPAPFVLQGHGFLATGKIANLATKPLHPGRKPFVSLINTSMRPDPNAEIVASLFDERRSTDITVDGSAKGRILEDPLSIVEAANLLDQLTFDGYTPGSSTQIGELWSQVEARIAAVQPLGTDFHLYRPAHANEGEVASAVRSDCPYSISAYLRLWHAASSRHVRGLFVTGERAQLWSMADLAKKTAELPRFWVGIRYGAPSAQSARAPFDRLPFDVRTTAKAVENGLIKGTWGSNDPTAGPSQYRGDEFFDYYHRGDTVPSRVGGEDLWRPPGADGLILFYVNQRPVDEHPTIAVGVCIPAGGPDQFAAHSQQKQ